MSWQGSIEKAMELMEELPDEDIEGFKGLPTEKTSKISPQGWTVVKGPYGKSICLVSLDER